MNPPTVQAALAALAAGQAARARRLLRELGPAAADDPLALQTWAVCLEGAEADAIGEALLERATRIAPGDPQAHFNLGVALQRRGDFPRAIAHYHQTLALEPGHLGALNNLSDLLRRRGRADEGWDLMSRYLAEGGAPGGMELRMAKLALDTRRFDEAETWFQAAATRAPGSSQVAFEHAMLTLLREDFARGWPQYEARIAQHGLAGLGIFPYPMAAWDGEARPGEAILLHREQGLGDMMMFASALEEILARGATPHLAMDPALNRLFAASFPEAKVWSSITHIGVPAQPPQPFLKVCGPLTAQAPMASLGALRMREGPPTPRPYLSAPPEETARWAERLERLAPRRAGERRIGLTFGARLPRFNDDGLTNGIRKSIPPLALEPLADVANARWFSLQDRQNAAGLADIPRLAITDLSPWITDFADTAAAIANLDLVISVDTAVAHLAGAMGKPLWVALWRNCDWRWGASRTDSLWYPQVTTFRQTKAHDWAPVVAAMVAALS